MQRLSADEISASIEKLRHAIFSKANTTQLSKRQRASLKDASVLGQSWVSRVTFTAPHAEENDARQLLVAAIERLGCRNEEYTLPSIENVNAEWTGFRPGATLDEAGPSIPEKENYENLMNDVRSEMTIFYIQGGAFVLNTPARFRSTTTRLAELTGGRCVSISYRLAPQNPYPAALLDVLVAYLSLLYPPVGSCHSPIQASSMVLAGDSSGANLVLALVQIILTARRDQATEVPSVRFHGQTVLLPMPSGLALQSPALDQTNSLPSWYSSGKFDVVQKTSPVLLPDYPICPIWPSLPPRGDVYCETSMLCHPLVSHVNAPYWTGAPPMWISMGEERLSDGGKIVAQTAAKQGVPVRWESYRAMPHNWPMLFPGWWQSERCMQHWANICKAYTHGEIPRTGGEEVNLDGEVKDLDVMKLIDLTHDEVEKLMRANQGKVRPWTGKGLNEKL